MESIKDWFVPFRKLSKSQQMLPTIVLCLVIGIIWMVGYEYTPDNLKIPGATVRRIYDLTSMGLAW